MPTIGMSTRLGARAGLLAALLWTASPQLGPAAAAQQAPVPPQDRALAEAQAGLAECAGLAERRDLAGAAAGGRTTQARFEAYVARNPRSADGRVGLARAIAQCVLPSSDLIGQGELSAQAIELLESALEIDPSHWTGRFVLANIYFRSPGFLGRAPLAARELDVLLRLQGDRADNPRFARVFEMRGTLLQRAGMTDSARAVWARGSTVFPADTSLRRLATPPTPPPSAPSTTSPSGSASLAAVQVVASASAPAPSAPSVQEVTRSKVLRTAGGTADVLQVVQMQPGATRVTEGSDVYTRGGGASETALLVNGGRIASLSRFEGLSGGMFGALEPFVVSAVRYSSGGFSARHGNALSGVLEIDTDGRPRERALRAGLSMTQASATVRAPLSPKVGGWASGRASHTGVLLAAHGRRAEYEGSPHSQEMVASVIASPSPTSELRATGLAERDDARRIVTAGGWDGPFHSRGGVRALLLSSRWMPGSAPVIVRANLAGSARESAWDFGVLSRTRDEGSAVGRADVEWAAREALTLRGGVEHGRFTRSEAGALPTTSSVALGAPVRVIGGDALRTEQLGGYVEAEATAGGASMLVGLRADRLPGESETTFDPRMSLSARRGAWVGRVSAGLFHQGRWQSAPAIPDAGTPSGTPRAARHLVAGVERAGETTLRVEAYDKRYSHYSPLGDGPTIERASARGVDVLAQRAMSSTLTGWIGYSLLDAEVELVDGRRARSAYDVTHTLTATMTAAVHSDWSVGATSRYGTGAPMTPVTGGITGPDGRVSPQYGALMSERLPAYVRVDARLMRFVRTPAFLLTSFVEVLNVAGRANASGMTYDAAYRTRIPTYSFFAQRTVVVGAELQLR